MYKYQCGAYKVTNSCLKLLFIFAAKLNYHKFSQITHINLLLFLFYDYLILHFYLLLGKSLFGVSCLRISAEYLFQK
jgi:hypothetical protein